MLVKIWFTFFFVLLFAGIEYIGVQRYSMEVTAVLRPADGKDGHQWCTIEINNNKTGALEDLHKVSCSENKGFSNHQAGIMWYGYGRITSRKYKNFWWKKH